MTLTVTIDSLTYGGSCIGRVTDTSSPHSGKKIFIPATAPGEVVQAEIAADKKNFLEGTLLKILTPSPERRVPPCRYYSVCGGCDLQHLSIKGQREAKRKMVEDTLHFQGKIASKSGVTLLGSSLPEFYYRRRIGLHINPKGEIGFFKPKTGVVVPIQECLLATAALNAALQKLIPLGHELGALIGGAEIEEHDGKTYLLLKYREESTIELSVALLRRARDIFPYLEIERKNKRFLVDFDRKPGEIAYVTPPIGHFSQVNEAGNDVLIASVLDELKGCGSLTELYAGSGNFSFPLAYAGIVVTAVEVDSMLVKYGIEQAKLKNLSHSLKFISLSCERYVQGNKLGATVLLDPPRAGAKEIVKHLSPKNTKKVVYISCNLPSLTRDARTLIERGYSLSKLMVLDMFSQTHHVESIAVFE